MKGKLSGIHAPWRRLLIRAVINIFLLCELISDQNRAHWLGRPRFHLHPLAQWGLLAAALFIGIFILPDLPSILLWIAGWGAMMAFYTIALSVSLFIMALKGKDSL